MDNLIEFPILITDNMTGYRYNSSSPLLPIPTSTITISVDPDIPASIGSDDLLRDRVDLVMEWDMGDGTTYRGKSVTHTYNYAGSYTINCTCFDGAGNRLPNIIDAASRTVIVDSVWDVGVSISDTSIVNISDVISVPYGLLTDIVDIDVCIVDNNDIHLDIDVIGSETPNRQHLDLTSDPLSYLYVAHDVVINGTHCDGKYIPMYDDVYITTEVVGGKKIVTRHIINPDNPTIPANSIRVGAIAKLSVAYRDCKSTNTPNQIIFRLVDGVHNYPSVGVACNIVPITSIDYYTEIILEQAGQTNGNAAILKTGEKYLFVARLYVDGLPISHPMPDISINNDDIVLTKIDESVSPYVADIATRNSGNYGLYYVTVKKNIDLPAQELIVDHDWLYGIMCPVKSFDEITCPVQDRPKLGWDAVYSAHKTHPMFDDMFALDKIMTSVIGGVMDKYTGLGSVMVDDIANPATNNLIAIDDAMSLLNVGYTGSMIDLPDALDDIVRLGSIDYNDLVGIMVPDDDVFWDASRNMAGANLGTEIDVDDLISLDETVVVYDKAAGTYRKVNMIMANNSIYDVIVDDNGVRKVAISSYSPEWGWGLNIPGYKSFEAALSPNDNQYVNVLVNTRGTINNGSEIQKYYRFHRYIPSGSHRISNYVSSDSMTDIITDKQKWSDDSLQMIMINCCENILSNNK